MSHLSRPVRNQRVQLNKAGLYIHMTEVYRVTSWVDDSVSVVTLFSVQCEARERSKADFGFDLAVVEFGVEIDVQLRNLSLATTGVFNFKIQGEVFPYHYSILRCHFYCHILIQTDQCFVRSLSGTFISMVGNFVHYRNEEEDYQ